MEGVFREIEPLPGIGLPLKPRLVTRQYLTWPLLPTLFPVSFPGVKTSRDDVVIDIDRGRLVERMRQYFDLKVSDEELARTQSGAMRSSGQYQADVARPILVRRGFLPDNVMRYCYRPFDNRWLYWEPDGYLLDRNRAEYVPHVFAGNIWIEARQRQPMERFDRGFVTTVLGDNFGNGLSSFFPLRLNADAAEATLLDPVSHGHVGNLTPDCTSYLGLVEADADALFRHIGGVLRTPAYASENAGALRQDWPRIPLPATRDALLASAELGRTVAALLDVEEPVDAVTTGSVRHELRPLGVLTSVSGRQLDPSAGDLAVTAGWGHDGKGSVTMPGRGRALERPYTDAELAAFREGLSGLGLSYDQLTACLGGACYDVYASDVAYWRCVPARAWKYTIGGYQVMKKWLSYRERALLGRDLKPDEARYVTEMTRRIAAILLLESALDANYARVKADTYPWPGGDRRA